MIFFVSVLLWLLITIAMRKGGTEKGGGLITLTMTLRYHSNDASVEPKPINLMFCYTITVLICVHVETTQQTNNSSSLYFSTISLLQC